MVIVSVISVGVVAKDMLDYQRWVARQSYDENRRYFPIVNPSHAETKYDEIVITSTANVNPNYVDIYIKLNGAYAKARPETSKAI